MNELLQNLLKLQSLEFNEVKDKGADALIVELRAKIPAQILSHYDRLVAKGKKGVAGVRGQVCTGCHMSLPVAVIMTLRRGDDIQLCGSCGRYLYLLEEKEAEPVKPVKKARKSKSSLQLV